MAKFIPQKQDKEVISIRLTSDLLKSIDENAGKADFLKANEHDIFSPLEKKVWNHMLKGEEYREIAGHLPRHSHESL